MLKNTKIRTSAGSAAHRRAHVKGEKLAQWPYVGIELTSQLPASVSQGWIYSDELTCYHSEIADQTFYLTQSQYTDTGPTSLSADPVSLGAWQGNHLGAIF